MRWLSIALPFLAASAALAQGGEVNVICSVPIPWCEALAAAFLKDTGIKVNITQKPSADAMTHIAAEKADSKHDVWFAGSGDSHVQAGEIGLTDEYRSPLIAHLHDWAVRQAEQSKWHSVGVHAGMLGIGYNSKVLATKHLPEPRCWADLARPEYHNEVQMPNPISSMTGYATIATLVQIFGEDKAFEVLRAMHRNIEDYPRTGTGAIRAAARGETMIGVAYVHDGITEIANGFPIRLTVPCEGTGYEVASMSIIRGARNPQNARRFYDWALSPAAQKIGGDMKNFQMPSNRATPLPAATPDLGEFKLIRYDFIRFGSAAERKRLLEKWDREVHALPR